MKNISGQTDVYTSFSDTPSAGTYWYGIHVVDTAGNCTTEENKDCISPHDPNGGADLGPVKVVVNPVITGTAYYVSLGGSNTAPYDSWAKAINNLATLNTINFPDNSVIIFRPGDIFPNSQGSITLAAVAGANKTITFRGLDGDGRTIIANGRPKFDADPANTDNFNIELTNGIINALNFYNLEFEGQADGFSHRYIYTRYVNDIHIDGVDANGYGGGTYSDQTKTYFAYIYQGTGRVEIENCHIQNLGPSNMPVNGFSDSYAFYFKDKNQGNFHIHDTIIHDINADALQTQGIDAAGLIEHNEWYNCGENAVDLKHSKNITIRENLFYRTSGFTGSGGVPASSVVGPLITLHNVLGEYDYDNDYTTANILIEKNYLFDYPEGAAFQVGDSDGLFNGVTVQHNLIKGAYYGVYSEGTTDRINTKYLNNVFINSVSSAVTENHSGVGAEFYGNTIVNTVAPTAINQSGNHRAVVNLRWSNSIYRNNVFVNTGPEWILYNGSGSPTANNNLYYNISAGNQDIISWKGTIFDEGELTSGDDWRSAHSGALFQDPVFSNVNSLELWPGGGSPLIGGGADLSPGNDFLIGSGSVYSKTVFPAVNTIQQTSPWTVGAYAFPE